MNKTFKTIRFTNKYLKVRLIGTYVFPFLMVCLSFLNSCISHKNTILIREKQATAAFDSLSKYSIVTPDYPLKPKDVLSIYVSSFRPEITNFFNADKIGTFPIQDNGYVYLPIIDSIKAADLTIDKLRKELREAIRKYASDAYVSVNLVSFNVTVLGEVGTPGIKSIGRDRITLFEVLGMAGGITDFGDNKRVKVIRKLDDGVKIVTIDVTNTNVLLSQYYYLLPGDVIYVQPISAKTLTFNVRQISLFLGFATVLYILNILLNRLI